jgi:hypothetical protein
VAEFQVSELAALGVGGEGGETVAVDVGEPQLRAGVRAFLRTMTRIPRGQFTRSSMPVISATQAPGRAWPPAS